MAFRVHGSTPGCHEVPSFVCPAGRELPDARNIPLRLGMWWDFVVQLILLQDGADQFFILFLRSRS